MSRELLNHPDFHTTDTSSLQTLGGGGAQLQPDLVAKIDSQVKTARPNTGYGMTETCGIITAVSADFFVDKPASVGPAMPTFETKCVDDDGVTVPAGEVGELWVKGSPVIKGYINRPEATADSITEGWLHTGDVARVDEDGFIFIVDRKKDMVLRGGGERLLRRGRGQRLPARGGVAECCVFGRAGHAPGRGGGRGHRAQARPEAGRRGPARAPVDPAVEAQDPALHLVPGLSHPAQRQRQVPEAGAARDAEARSGGLRLPEPDRNGFVTFTPLIPAKAGTQAFLLETPRPGVKNLGPRLRGDERVFDWFCMATPADLDLITLGRSSVDLYGEQVGGRLEDMGSFAKYIGGSPTNTAIGAARLGLRAGLITRVGADHFGRFIAEELGREGVDVRGVTTDPRRLTALAILGIRDPETFPLLFYRQDCADMAIAAADIDPAFIASASAVLINGTHLSTPGVFEASLRAATLARAGRAQGGVRYRLPPGAVGPDRAGPGREPLCGRRRGHRAPGARWSGSAT